MIRVVLADDHAMVRLGLAKLLGDEGDIRIVSEAATAAELFTALAATPADVVVLDVSMPGPGVIDVLKQLRAEHPRLRTLVLSMFSEEQYATRTLRGGAVGYLTKDQSPELLVDAIRKVARGGRFVTPSLAERLVANLGADAAVRLHDALSDREFEVLRSIGEGRSIKAIAARLNISPKTVSTYRTRLLEKLHAQTNADLVRYVSAHELNEK